MDLSEDGNRVQGNVMYDLGTFVDFFLQMPIVTDSLSRVLQVVY